MEITYQIYENTIVFAEKWRKYKLLSPKLDEEKFNIHINTYDWIRIDTLDESAEKYVYIFLVFDSKKNKATSNLKKLLSSVNATSDVIIITKIDYRAVIHKVAQSFKYLNIYNYEQKIFSAIIPEGPLCSPHEIMTKAEVNNLLNNFLYCRLVNLPELLQYDPQCVWIGAKVGDVLRIRSVSSHIGEYTQYRVVISKSGKPDIRQLEADSVVEYKETDDLTKEEDYEKDNVEETEEVDIEKKGANDVNTVAVPADIDALDDIDVLDNDFEEIPEDDEPVEVTEQDGINDYELIKSREDYS
jgi:DNA-directed RNA polymerase subunit H (RpoH/RPB5)